MKKCILSTLITIMLTISALTPIQANADEYSYDETEIIEVDSLDDLDNAEVQATCPVTVTATSYDPRKYNRVTSVKDQGKYGLCWDYAIQAQAESYLIAAGMADNKIDLSEIFYAYRAYAYYKSQTNNPVKFEDYTWDPVNGKQYDIIGSLKCIKGYALESKYPFPSTMTGYQLSSSQIEDYSYKANRGYEFSWVDETNTLQDKIKFAKGMVVNYGGAIASIEAGSYHSQFYRYEYNTTNETAQYCNQEASCHYHAVEIVGWDDNYSANNFTITPPGKGAFLCKNSWGTGNSHGNGYFWLSYYDKSIDAVCTYSLVKASDNMFSSHSYKGIVGTSIDVSKDIPGETLKSISLASFASGAQDITNNNILFTAGKGTVYGYDEYGNTIGEWTLTGYYDKLVLKNNAGNVIKNTTLAASKTNSAAPVMIGKEIPGFSFVTNDVNRYNFSYSNPDVVELKSSKLIAKGFGTTTVTVTWKDDVLTDGKTLTYQFNITLTEYGERTMEDYCYINNHLVNIYSNDAGKTWYRYYNNDTTKEKLYSELYAPGEWVTELDATDFPPLSDEPIPIPEEPTDDTFRAELCNVNGNDITIYSEDGGKTWYRYYNEDFSQKKIYNAAYKPNGRVIEKDATDFPYHATTEVSKPQTTTQATTTEAPKKETTTEAPKPSYKKKKVTIGGTKYQTYKSGNATVLKPDKTNKKTYTIPKSIKIWNGKMYVTYAVTKVNKNAYSKCTKVKKIVIKPTKLTVGKNAFNCKTKNKLTITTPTKSVKKAVKKSTKGIKKVK